MAMQAGMTATLVVAGLGLLAGIGMGLLRRFKSRGDAAVVANRDAAGIGRRDAAVIAANETTKQPRSE